MTNAQLKKQYRLLKKKLGEKKQWREENPFDWSSGFYLCNIISENFLKIENDFKNRLLKMDDETFKTTILFQMSFFINQEHISLEEGVVNNFAFWRKYDFDNRDKFLQKIIDSL